MRAVAAEAGAELVEDDPQLVVVFGGDGTMLRAFHEFLGRVPVIGINFGRFGFLASIQPDELESGLRRALAGDYVVIELPTLEFEQKGASAVAVNDVVAASAVTGASSSSSGRSAASRSERFLATESSSPLPEARPRTTSRTTGPF